MDQTAAPFADVQSGGPRASQLAHIERDTDELIQQKRVEVITGQSKSTIWRKVAAGEFPQPIRLGTQCTRWSLHEILQWVEARKRERPQIAAQVATEQR